jgi:hypothetical protein
MQNPLPLDVLDMQSNLVRKKFTVVVMCSRTSTHKVRRPIDGAYQAHLNTLLVVVGLVDREDIYPQILSNAMQPCLPQC